MNAEDFANMIRLARRAPLANMDEAEAVAALLQKFAAHAQEQMKVKENGGANKDGELDKYAAQ